MPQHFTSPEPLALEPWTPHVCAQPWGRRMRSEGQELGIMPAPSAHSYLKEVTVKSPFTHM